MSPRPYIILAALDLQRGSTPVLDQTLELAAAHPLTEIHVVTVMEPELPLGVYPSTFQPEYRLPTSEKTAEFCREYLAAYHERMPRASLPHMVVHAVVGWAADEIVWLAAHLDADMVVMATHGRRGVKRLLLGSVAEKVMRLAGCPVLVVREKAHDPGARIPDIEPLCTSCAAKRAETGGKQLWCARHSEHHVRAHVLHYGAVGEDAPHAWSSSTGT